MKRTEIKRRPLADTTLNNLEPEEKEYRELDGNGLYLRVKPTGSKIWQLRYKNTAGKWRWHTIGVYPRVPAKKAREEAFKIKKNIDAGIMPQGDGQAITFTQAAEDWLNHKVVSGVAYSSTRQMRLYLDKDILPVLGLKQLADVKRADCAKVQRRLEARGSTAIASKVRSWLSQIFSRAVAQGWCEINPASELASIAITHTKKNYPYLTEAELPEFLRILRHSSSHLMARTATWMALRTASRCGMVRQAEWSEIDFSDALWTVPAHKMKSRRDHLVPLSTQVIADLRELHDRTGRHQYLFPAQGGSCEYMSENTINMVIKRCGYGGRLVGHGVRHTASTLLHEHDWPHAQIEAQLAHKEKGVAGVYNKAEYLPQRREMMQWYSDYLDTLEGLGRE